jgi:hypothetical protein|tara:strand:+ start:114688 stop:114888 length:201 start_codon:yes stop_codon:yes gene_type:complete
MAKLHLHVKVTPAANKIHSHPAFVAYDENLDDFVYKKKGVQKDKQYPFKSLIFFIIRVYDFTKRNV